MTRNVLILIVLLLIAGCAGVKLTQSAITDLERMKQKVPGISYEEALAGFNLYKSKCNSCHGLYRPGEFTKEDWERLLPEMLIKAKISEPVEKKNLTDYLIANSK